jgi:hypothetical protein
MSYKDDLKIFLNIMAQSPDGLGDPQLIGKFAKAKAVLHAQQSMEQMSNSPMMANQSPQGTMSPTSNNTAQNDGSMPQTPESTQNTPNTPSTPQGGQGTLNLPQ